MKRIFNKLNEINIHNYSLVFLFVGFLIGWTFNLPIVQLITTTIYVAFILLFSFNAYLMSPLILVGLFSIPEFFYFDTIPIIFILELCVFIFGCVCFIVKNLIFKKIDFDLGCIGKSLLLFCASVIVATTLNYVNIDGVFDKVSLFVCLILLLVTLVYLFFTNFKDKTPDNYLSNIFYSVNCIIIFETGYICYKNGVNINGASLILGWSTNHNVFSMALEFVMPFILMIFIKNKKRFDALLIILIDVLLIASCKSRMGLAIGLLFLIVLYVFFISRLIKKSSSTIEKMYLILFTSLIVIGSCVFKNQIISTINRFIKEGLNLSDRDVVWELAIGYYKKYPLFGAGIQSLFEIQQIRVPDSVGLGIFFCHNTFITILCVGGIVGFVCFLYHVFETFRVTFELDKYNKYAYLLFLMVGLLHGLVDNTFFSIEYLLPFIVVFSVIPKLKRK